MSCANQGPGSHSTVLKPGRIRVSAGILLYRKTDGQLEVLLAHPGGPHFAQKDRGHWTIPKGEPDGEEELHAVALREFTEETGMTVTGPYLELGWIQQKGGKIVHAWAAETSHAGRPKVTSNRFKMEWPPRSGRFQEFPEVDRAEFFQLAEAREKIKETQRPFLDRLEEKILAAP